MSDIKCTVCGCESLLPDPAGYYCHAEREDGASLMCMDWNISVDAIFAHSGYAADRASKPREV